MYIKFLAWKTTAVRIVVLYWMCSGSRVYNHYHFSDFSISPQGSLDQAIEEDCFTSVNLLTDKIQQETVSQSAPTSIEEHCRSLPNMEEFENETLVFVLHLHLLFGHCDTMIHSRCSDIT